MDHCMAVGAQRYQVGDGVQLVPATEHCRRHDVVHVDETPADVAEGGLEGEATGSTGSPVESQAPPARVRGAFLPVDVNAADVVRCESSRHHLRGMVRRRPHVAPQLAEGGLR